MQTVKLLVYSVKDVAKAKSLFNTLLGVEPYVDTPYYVGYHVGDQEIGLDPHGHNSGIPGPIAYWAVENIHQSVQALTDAGGQVQQAPRDVGGGMLVALVKDADGNVVGLRQA